MQRQCSLKRFYFRKIYFSCELDKAVFRPFYHIILSQKPQKPDRQ